MIHHKRNSHFEAQIIKLAMCIFLFSLFFYFSMGNYVCAETLYQEKNMQKRITFEFFIKKVWQAITGIVV